jgi:predicted negative regulator of RcsB-dependent stress response
MATEVKQKQVTGHASDKSSEERVVDSARHFWERNSKFITYVVTALVLVVGGWFVYKNYVVAPAEQKADDMIWKAQNFYKIDSFAKALNGDGPSGGFLRVISRHGGTKAGNLAKFYAGSCYLELGDFNNAIKYLKDYDAEHPVMKIRTLGLIGDAYAEQGKKKEAVENYEKAASIWEEDDVNTPEYLFRAAMINAELGKNKEAIAQLKQIKDKYPDSQHARMGEVDKYLGKLGDLN